MKYVALAVALGFAGPALAADSTDSNQASNEPVLMTEMELDAVVAGQPNQEGLINVNVSDVDVDIDVVANVNALVNANVLGEQGNVTQDAVNLTRIF
jgi:hypothetical protein